MTLILEAFSPVRILTVRGMGLPSAIPATSLASLEGFRSKAAPSPLRVASAWSCMVIHSLHACPFVAWSTDHCANIKLTGGQMAAICMHCV